jgi:hypothetical protein
MDDKVSDRCQPWRRSSSWIRAFLKFLPTAQLPRTAAGNRFGFPADSSLDIVIIVDETLFLQKLHLLRSLKGLSLSQTDADILYEIKKNRKNASTM